MGCVGILKLTVEMSFKYVMMGFELKLSVAVDCVGDLRTLSYNP